MHPPTSRPSPDQRHERGPFDLIGDVHGCHDELAQLLGRLGYAISSAGRVQAPVGRRAVFLGDLVDRGPKIPAVLRLVMGMVSEGTALCVLGNHEHQMLRRFRDPTAPVEWGLAETLVQLAGEPAAFRDEVRRFAEQLPVHLILDEGKLVVAHAGLPEELHGQSSREERLFALYSARPEELDGPAPPARGAWARHYRGAAQVVYGHTPCDQPTWVHGTLCIDTGCVYGGHLTALRYPEGELVSVPAQRVHYHGA